MQPYTVCARGNFILVESKPSRSAEAVMTTLELKPEEFPITVRLRCREAVKEYVLIMTKQGKLLLNKPVEVPRSSK